MNKELEQKLIEVINKSIELAEKTGKFIIEQSSELIQQFFIWKIIYYFIWIIGAIIVGIAIQRFMYYGFSKNGKINEKLKEKYDLIKRNDKQLRSN